MPFELVKPTRPTLPAWRLSLLKPISPPPKFIPASFVPSPAATGSLAISPSKRYVIWGNSPGRGGNWEDAAILMTLSPHEATGIAAYISAGIKVKSRLETRIGLSTYEGRAGGPTWIAP